MVKLFSIKEMRLLEQEANKCGLSYDDMMENAGVGIANEIISAYSHFTNKKIISLVGSGNNGGDALVALSHLSENGWETYAYIVRSRELNDPLLARLSKLDCGIINLQDDINFNQLDAMLDKCSVVIDGIFGTGIKLPLQNETARVLQAVKEKLQQMTKKVYVVAVDCPSGIDCDTGEVAIETIPADITVTMAGFKLGLIKSPALNYTGIIRVASIGNIGNFDHYRQNEKYVVTDDFVRINLPKRALEAHKGTFGTAFIIAGSVSYTGAALLAGKAAYLSGVGLVTTAIPEPLHSAISGQFPESTWVVLPHENGVISVDAVPVIYDHLDRATAILIGPGLGRENTTKEFVKMLLTNGEPMAIGFGGDQKYIESWKLKIPVIIDADGLKLLSEIEQWNNLLPPNSILTPHPGEMAVLTGLPIAEIQNNRVEIAKKYATSWGHIVVLKGAYTIIASPVGKIAIIPVATPALAKAGTGDVLAGLIAGLTAQGVDAYTAACIGAWLHGNAGLYAADLLGNTASVVASDVLNQIPTVISRVLSKDN